MLRPSTPINILVVDDENFFAEWLAENLQDMSQHYHAHWVTSGERALEFIEQQSVDLVISDIKMGGVSGIELLNRIRLQQPSIGVILMTGYALPELQQDVLQRGSLLYLEKPFPLERLESAIEQALNTSPAVTQPPPEYVESVPPPLSLIDTLHLFHLSRSNQTLLVKSADSEGLIYFQDGEVVHSVNQEENGDRAFHQILNWHSSDFEVFSGESPPSRSIYRDFESLLRGTLLPTTEKVMVESLIIEPASPPSEVAPETEIPPPPPVSADAGIEATSGPVSKSEDLASLPVSHPIQPDLESSPPAPDLSPIESRTDTSPRVEIPGGAQSIPPSILRELQEVLGATEQLEGGAVVTTGGDILASMLPGDVMTHSAAAHAKTLFEMSCRVAEELGRGGHRQSLIHGEAGYVIVAQVSLGAFVLFVTHGKATLGLALLQARQKAQQASQLLVSAGS